MTYHITEGVSINVETYYQSQYSNPLVGEYLFAYRITIENQSAHPVQLLSRHWDIIDSNGVFKEVDGEGVIGAQPIIESGTSYQYSSGVNLYTDMGKMRGYYNMRNMYNNRLFKVFIPEFELIAPFKNN